MSAAKWDRASTGAMRVRSNRTISMLGLAVTLLWAIVGLGWLFALAGAEAWLVVLMLAGAAAAGTALLAARQARAEEARRAALRAWRAGRRGARQARRTRAEAALGAIEAMDAPLLGTDIAGLIDLANGPAREQFGARDPIGARIEDVLPHAEVLDMHQRAARGTASRARVRVGRDGALRVFDVTASPAPGGRVFVTLRDVTDLAQALQLKTDFVANASHELRTPLASIRAAVETLGTLENQPALRARLTRMIEENAARLEDLVNDLLDLSRLESPEAAVRLVPVDVVEVARAVEEMFEANLSAKGLEMRVEIPAPLRRVESDKHLVTLALKNLVDNAIKFSREGTVVRVVAREVPGAWPGARPGARLEVMDRGMGIPLEHQPRIFERFYQVDSARTGTSVRRGTGLGLAIVKHAVRLLRGSVGVQSEWQQGTTVWFELPDCVIDEGATQAGNAARTA